jgi:hypothetical protein
MKSGWKGWTVEVTEDARKVWQIPFIGAELSNIAQRQYVISRIMVYYGYDPRSGSDG